MGLQTTSPLLDYLRSKGRAPSSKKLHAAREKLRRPRTRKYALKTHAALSTMRLAADWVSYVRRCHAVMVRATPSSPSTPSAPSDHSPTGLLHWFESLPQEERTSIVKDFEEFLEYEPDSLTAMYSLDTVGKQLSGETMFIQAGMHQIALGEENVVTYCIRFGDEWLERTIGGRKSETVTQIINREISNALQDTWQEHSLTGHVSIPPDFHMLDFPAEMPELRGVGGFHVHGLTVADNRLLPAIKIAFEKASNGYKKCYSNKRVHFGEPSLNYSNRGARKENCLSDYRTAIRIKPENHTFNAAGYISWKKPRAQAAGEALGVDVGNCWGRSPGLKIEAEACLRLFKMLLEGLTR